MPPLRGEEEWARQLIEAELGVPVAQHDDGSRPGMHDLDVIYSDGPGGAVEVAAAVDAQSTELWNLVNSGDRWVEPDLRGGWLVTVKPTARGLRRELPTFLQRLERAGVRDLGIRTTQSVAETAQRLGIVRATQSGTEFPGSIYVLLDLPVDQVAGYAANTGDALPEWLSSFLAEEPRMDLRKKLALSGAAERHAFVVVSGLSGAQFAVTDLLMRDEAPLPAVAPELPPEVTDVWAISTWASGLGFRWSCAAQRWQTFSKRWPTTAAQAETVGEIEFEA